MSSSQQVTFKNWQFYVFFLSTAFTAGGAWHRLDELAVSQQISIRQRTEMMEAIIRMQEQIKSLEQRLEAKKVVNSLLPRINVAGEAWKVKE